MNQPRHPHPVLAAALGAAVAALAVVGTQQATRQPHTVGGYHSSFVIQEAGTYTGQGAAPQISLAGRKQSDVCVLVKADNVTVRGLQTSGGFRGVQANDHKNLRFENCTIQGAGTVGARGGNNWFTVNVKGLTLDNCRGLASEGSHCTYLSNWAHGTTENVLIQGGLYTNHLPPASVLQINTESGGPTKNIKITGATFKDTNGSGCLNLLGAGTPNDPIIFNDCDIFGEVNADNWSAGRSSFIKFTNSRLTARPGKPALRVAMQSRVWLDARTVVKGAVQELSGGKVVRQ